MAKKRYKPEEIVIKLRQVEVLQSQGMVVSDAIRQIGVSEVTYYRWRKEYRGMAIHHEKMDIVKVLMHNLDANF